MKKVFISILFSILSGMVLFACNSGSSSASAGLTEAQVVSIVNQQLAPIQAELPHSLVLVSGSGATALKLGQRVTLATSTPAPTPTTGSTAIGTYMGDGTVAASTTELVQSSTGYFCILNTAVASTSYCQAPYPIFYDEADCTGNAYINAGPTLAEGYLEAGFVFSPSGGAVSGDYLYSATNAQSTAFQAESVLTGPGQCTDEQSPLAIAANPTQPNVQSVTGIPNQTVATAGFGP